MSRRLFLNLRVLGVLLAVAVPVGVAVLSAQVRSGQAEPDRPAETPRVLALGRVEPLSRLIRVAAPTGVAQGRIAHIAVAEGDAVQAGDVLAVLDTEPALAAALRRAEATVALKLASLARSITDSASQDEVLAATLRQQTAERDRAEWELERMRRLSTGGVYNTTALTDRRFALAAAENRLEVARLQLNRNMARDVTGVRIDEAAARAELADAQGALTQAQADHARSRLLAPITGRVLQLIGRPGEQIPTEGFAELGDTRVMLVRAEVFESDYRYLAPGLPAVVTSRALDAPLSGRVERVGLRIGQQSIIREDPAASVDSRVFEVLVRLDEASSRRVAGLSNLQVRVSLPRAGAPGA
jgi:HlyD family secretion protein